MPFSVICLSRRSVGVPTGSGSCCSWRFWKNVVWSGMVWYNMVWNNVVWCGVVTFGVVWCGLIWSTPRPIHVTRTRRIVFLISHEVLLNYLRRRARVRGLVLYGKQKEGRFDAPASPTGLDFIRSNYVRGPCCKRFWW